MIFAPVKALYSVKFYLEYIKKSGWKAFAFTVYLFVVTSVLLALAAFFAAKPQIGSVVDKVARYIPQITVESGKVTVNDDKPLTLAPPELKGYKIYFNTGSKEPVYPTEMETSKTMISVSSDTVYFKLDANFQQIKVPLDAQKLSVSSDIIKQHKAQIVLIIIWSLIFMRVIMQIFIVPFMIILAFVTAAVIGAFCGAQLRGGELFKAACYMQPAALFISIILFALHFEIPFIAYIIIFIFYSFIICKGHVTSRGGNGDTADKA